MNRLLKDFANYLQLELNRSPHTVEAYLRDIRMFASWIAGSPEEFDPVTVTTGDIRAWLGEQGETDTPRTIRRKTQSLRALYQWLMRRNLINSNPAAAIVLAKTSAHLPEFVIESEIEDAIRNYHPESFRECRTHIVLLLFYTLGLRQEELRTLTDDNVDMSLMEIKVTGKRNKQRILPIPEALAAEIRHWQQIRDAHLPDLPTPRPLIAGTSGFISKATLYNIVNKGLTTISAHKKSPHVLRHTFATSMLNHGASLDSVKEFLGHTSLSTTQIYTHLSFAELRDAYNASHPRSRDEIHEKNN